MTSNNLWIPVQKNVAKNIQKLDGPILVVGAGGFVGFNVLTSLLQLRSDVMGFSSNFTKNWRFKVGGISRRIIHEVNIENEMAVEKAIQKIKPKTIFYLAAYGAYSDQTTPKRIYDTNIVGLVSVIEAAKKFGLTAVVHAGSSSEYGLNSAGPNETAELVPNSHYAVSKVGAYYAIKYYGVVERLPVVDLRLYSIYGPWEEPRRLIPTLVHAGSQGTYPPLVNPSISRDFIYVADAVSAFITAAAKLKPTLWGQAYNVGTGTKTTIKQVAEVMRGVAGVATKPKFGTMLQRRWDVKDWYGSVDLVKKRLGWQSRFDLVTGLGLTLDWQMRADYQRLLEELG